MSNTMIRTTTIAAMLLGTAAAHDGMGPHGGRLADTGTHHLELVVNNDAVEVFVSTKASQPIDATGLTGLAIVVADGSSTRIALTGADAAKLVGKAAATLSPGAKSVVQVKLAGGQSIQASFD